MRISLGTFNPLIPRELQDTSILCALPRNCENPTQRPIEVSFTFLSAIADLPLIDAARCVRDEKNRSNEVRSLFFRAGNEIVDEITLVADMLIPAEGVDELGQTARASITFLQYTLVLGYETDAELQQIERLIVRREKLQHINVGDARKQLAFEHSPKWRKSVVHGRRSSPFISTVSEQNNTIIKLHQEGGMGGGSEKTARFQTSANSAIEYERCRKPDGAAGQT